jgi:5-methylcytosine-specific restriction endonuclease McrA
MKKEELEKLVAESFSVSSVCRKLGKPARGSVVRRIAALIDDFGIDRSHFNGKDDSGIASIKSSTALRRKLLDNGHFEHKCYSCDLTMWLGKKIPLELHHKDGDHTNDALENLTVLCPNCHSTEHQPEEYAKPKKRKCLDCEKMCHVRSLRCQSCANKTSYNPKTKRPTIDILKKDLIELDSYCAIGRKYSVSDNAVRKWVKFYNLE